jgi:hypothetical protein
MRPPSGSPFPDALNVKRVTFRNVLSRNLKPTSALFRQNLSGGHFVRARTPSRGCRRHHRFVTVDRQRHCRIPRNGRSPARTTFVGCRRPTLAPDLLRSPYDVLPVIGFVIERHRLAQPGFQDTVRRDVRGESRYGPH